MDNDGSDDTFGNDDSDDFISFASKRGPAVTCSCGREETSVFGVVSCGKGGTLELGIDVVTLGRDDILELGTRVVARGTVVVTTRVTGVVTTFGTGLVIVGTPFVALVLWVLVGKLANTGLT